MAASPSLAPRVTLAEYLLWEQEAAQKHEFASGEIVAMAGASRSHRGITPALARLMGNALGDGECEYFDADTKIVVAEADAAYYPDGGIACPPRFVDERAGAIDNPCVIFEVLSPSTEARDRGEKFRNYALLPSLQDYVLIATERVEAEVFSRQPDGSWLLRRFAGGDAAAFLPSVGIELPLRDLYVRSGLTV